MFSGQDLTFFSFVQANTLSDDYVARYFIKALDPDNDFADALNGAYIDEMPESGGFTVTVPASEPAAGVVIQYGFSVTGRNANPADEAALGSVIVGSEPVSTNHLLDGQRIAVSVYPNPTTELLFIQCDVPVEAYQVSTLTGQMLSRGATATRVSVADLPAGYYLLTVFTAEGQKTLNFNKR